ncbi:MAG: TIGR03084 family metal-binding protein [Ilumatobacter sp.]
MSFPAPTAASVSADLRAEQDALDEIVAAFEPAQWEVATASERWSVRDQIGHLAFFDQTAAWAITDEDQFRASLDGLSAVFEPGAGPEVMDNLTLGEYRTMSPEALLATWRANRQLLANAAATLADDARVIWYGPSMGAKSFLTARLMECWAHGQHVLDAVGGTRNATDRLQHIAQLGFITRKWTYLNRGDEMPHAAVRVELAAPSGTTWRFGPDDAEQSVIGSAEDFCLVVTQCRNVEATDLVVVGAAAQDWMAKAQAFAGGATDGPSA